MAGLGTLTLDLVAKTGNFSQGMKQAGDSAERESKRIEQSIGSTMDSIKGLGAAAIAGITINSVIETADSYVQMAAQIRNATKSQQEYEQVQKHLYETAQTTYRSLQEAQQVYLDVGSALKAYGASTEQALRITDSLSFSFTHNATAADKAATATNAFMKSVYSGKVTGDSFGSMLSAIPSIVDDLSASMGKSKDVILTMGNAGEISADQLKAAFDKSREANEALANAMENSLKDGLTNLSTAWSVLVGEMNLTYGVTNSMAAGLGALADNLDTVTNVAIVGAAFWVGSYIPAVYESIIALKGKLVANIEVMRAEQVANEITMQRTARIAHLTAVELANAEAQLVRMTGIARLAYLESTVIPLRTANTAALNADTTAQHANNASKNLGVIAGSRLASVLMGPVGLGIAVASVAAGWLMMRDNTSASTSAFDIHAGTVEELTAKYRELDELQRRTTLREVEKEVKKLGSSYTFAYSELSSYVEWLENSGSVSEKTARQMSELLTKYTKGDIDASAFATSVGNLTGVQKTHKDKIDDLTTAQSKAKVEYERVKDIQAKLTAQTEGAIDANNREAKSIDAKRIAQQKLNADQQSVYDKLQANIMREEYIRKNQKTMGWSRERAEFQADIRNDAKMGYTGPQTPAELMKIADANWEIQQQAKARTAAEQESLKTQKAQTKELEKQNKLTKNLGNGLVSNSHLKGLPIKSRESISGGSVRGYTAEFAQILGKELKGSINAFTSFNDKYHQGKGGRHPQGQAFDLRLNSGANSARVDAEIKALADKYGYVVKTLDEYKKPSKNSTGGHLHVSVTGRKDGQKGAKAELDVFDEIDNRAEQSAQNQLQLRLAVADEVTRIRMNLAEDEKEIAKAGYSDTEANALKAKYRERAENDVAIAQLALKTKVDSYSDYLKTEEQLLRESYAARQVETLNDFEMSKADRKKASDHLLQQLQIEADAIKRAEDFQVNSAFEAYLNQSEIVVKRYALERDEIAKTYRLTEATRQKLLEANKMGTFLELNNASSAVSQIGLDAAQSTMQRMSPQQYAQYDLQNQYSQASSGLTDAYNNQVSGINQLEDEQQRNAELLAAHEQYLQARAALDEQHAQQEKDLKDAQLDEQFASAEAGFGSMTEMLRKSGAERSGIYRAMLVMEKSASIARSIMAIQSGIAMASANPFPANIAAMASVAAATANIVSSIQSVSAGFYDGGYTGDGGKYVAAGIVHKGEVVWSQEDIARWGGVANVESMRLGRSLGGYSDGGIVGSTSTTSFPNIDFSSSQSAPTVNIHTLPGQTADVEWNDGVLEVRMRKIAQEVNKQSWDQMGNGNSHEASQIKRHFNIQPKR